MFLALTPVTRSCMRAMKTSLTKSAIVHSGIVSACQLQCHISHLPLSCSDDSNFDIAANPFLQPGVSEFIDDAVKVIIQKALIKGCDVSTPVLDFKEPGELKSLLDLDVTEDPATHKVLLNDIEKIVQYGSRSGHPHFYNQLYGGLDPYSQIGAWTTETLNCYTHTFEAGPVAIVVEQYIIQKICDIIGYENGDGLFCPGGSFTNILALHLARFKKIPRVKGTGLYDLSRLRMYTQEDAHYSLKKAASFLGCGMENVVMIKTNPEGQMDVDDLSRQIEADKIKDYLPFFVMATCGTTVLGAFDPLEKMSQVCDEHSLWLHCDACWGGGALLSPRHRHLLKGSERSDSLSWNFHKMSGVPLQCSALVVNDKDVLGDANSLSAEYLFQPDKCYDTAYDIGDRTVQCGRKSDGMKLWFQWKALGDKGMAARIDTAFDNARYFTNKLKAHEGFKLVLPEFECTNVCFWYIPPRLRGLAETEEWWQEVNDVAPKIKERMMREGTLMIAYQPLTSKGYVNFFRFVLHNPNNDYTDMDFVMSEFERLGEDL